MLMAKRDSIRDVIAFPKVKDASCLLTNAPDVVDAKQLDELSIKIEEEKTEEEDIFIPARLCGNFCAYRNQIYCISLKM